MTELQRAFFLDRDGTLIEDPGYLSDPAGVRVLPGVLDALERLKEAGYLLVIITNQSGIGRGYFTEEDYGRVQERVENELPGLIDRAYHCPHHPDSKCSCRKPAPGMLLQAARDLGIHLPGSFAVGDRIRDVEAGLAAGCGAVLLGDGPAPDGVRLAASLPEAVASILLESK